MMALIWSLLMTQVFFPGGAVSLEAAAYEAHLRTQLEAPAPPSALVGAAGHIVSYLPPRLAPAL